MKIRLPKLHITRLSKKVQICLLAIAVLATAGIGYVVVRDTSQPTKDRKVIYDSDENKPVEDQLLKIDKNAKSAVCDAISGATIEKTIGQKISSTRVSIPNTTNRDGSVSACAYIVAEDDDGPIRSIIISTRQFDKIAAADSAYAILTKTTDKNRKNLSNDAFYNQESSQLVAIKDRSLSTVSISRTNSDKISEKTFKKLLDIL